MKSKIFSNSGRLITKLGIGCIVSVICGFGVLLYAQDKGKGELIATKPDVKISKAEAAAAEVKKLAERRSESESTERQNRGQERRNRGGVDFGENEAFYQVIIDNNLFRPLGWKPPNEEPVYSLIGTAVGGEGGISQATLLETRSNRYHFVTIGSEVGDMTVKDIQAKQVTLDNAGKPLTLRSGGLQFLATSRGGQGSRGGGGTESSRGSDSGGGDRAGGRSGGESMKAAASKNMSFGGLTASELGEKLRGASPAERREIMQKIRSEAGGDRIRRGGGDRGGRGRRGRD